MFSPLVLTSYFVLICFYSGMSMTQALVIILSVMGAVAVLGLVLYFIYKYLQRTQRWERVRTIILHPNSRRKSVVSEHMLQSTVLCIVYWLVHFCIDLKCIISPEIFTFLTNTVILLFFFWYCLTIIFYIQAFYNIIDMYAFLSYFFLPMFYIIFYYPDIYSLLVCQCCLLFMYVSFLVIQSKNNLGDISSRHTVTGVGSSANIKPSDTVSVSGTYV